MFEIKSPKKFLRQLIIIEFLLGLGLIAVGSLLLINVYVYLYINRGFYEYTFVSTIFRIILIITGLCKIVSFLLLKKSNQRGLNISMISLLLLASNFLYSSIFIFVVDLTRVLTGLHFMASFSLFVLSCIVILVSNLFFLTIFKNRENLKKHI